MAKQCVKKVWTDVKKFNLDGPYGLCDNLNGKIINRKVLSTIHKRRRVHHALRIFFRYGRSGTVFVFGKLYAKRTFKISEAFSLPFAYQ